MRIIAWNDPRFFAPLWALRDLQEEVEQLFATPGTGSSSPMSFALFAREGGLLLRTPLPGVEAKDIQLETDGNAVTVSGNWSTEPEGDAASAQHVERPRGRFSRTLHLPFEVDAARVQARLERGVLEVEIPRLEKSPPVKIQVLSPAVRN